MTHLLAASLEPQRKGSHQPDQIIANAEMMRANLAWSAAATLHVHVHVHVHVGYLRRLSGGLEQRDYEIIELNVGVEL